MLWFKFYNPATQNNVFLNLALYSIAIGLRDAELTPAMYKCDECFTIKDPADLARLKRVLAREAKAAEPADMGEPA